MTNKNCTTEQKKTYLPCITPLYYCSAYNIKLTLYILSHDISKYLWELGQAFTAFLVSEMCKFKL